MRDLQVMSSSSGEISRIRDALKRTLASGPFRIYWSDRYIEPNPTQNTAQSSKSAWTTRGYVDFSEDLAVWEVAFASPDADGAAIGTSAMLYRQGEMIIPVPGGGEPIAEATSGIKSTLIGPLFWIDAAVKAERVQGFETRVRVDPEYRDGGEPQARPEEIGGFELDHCARDAPFDMLIEIREGVIQTLSVEAGGGYESGRNAYEIELGSTEKVETDATVPRQGESQWRYLESILANLA